MAKFAYLEMVRPPDRGQMPVRTLRNSNLLGNLLIHGDNSHFNRVMTESAAAHMTLPGS
jgi:hypothetical protein